jgi:hypothetical protein
LYPPTPVKAQAALAHAAKGVPVFPLVPGGKEPMTPRGFYDATTDEETIRWWWGEVPSANVGIPTGAASGFFVLDVDTGYGFASLDELTRERGELPETRTQRTSGGAHYLFEVPAGEKVPNSAGRIAVGIDVRGDGGYIVAPPSRTESAYVVINEAPIAKAPTWLLEALRAPCRRQSEAASVLSSATVATNGNAIPEGRPNRTLFEHGCSLRGRGADPAKILAELRALNLEYCEHPLPDAEVRRIAFSAARYEPGNGTATPNRETIEAIEELKRAVLTAEWPGMAGKSDRDTLIALLWAGETHGTMIPAGARVSIAIREIALLAAVTKRTVIRALKRIRDAGWIRQDGSGAEGMSGAFVW